MAVTGIGYFFFLPER